TRVLVKNASSAAASADGSSRSATTSRPDACAISMTARRVTPLRQPLSSDGVARVVPRTRNKFDMPPQASAPSTESMMPSRELREVHRGAEAHAFVSAHRREHAVAEEVPGIVERDARLL